MTSPRPSKRQRIGRACAPCRRRKSKCDGRQPECTICRSAGRFCSYEDSGRRRGLQSGYVRSLEAALGLVLQHIPKGEEMVRRILRNRQRRGLLTNDAVDDCATLWRESRLANDVGYFLMPSYRGEERNDETDDGTEWEVIPLEPMERPNDEAMTPGDESGCPEPLPTVSNCFPQTSLVTAPQPKDCLERPFPDNTADLLDIYFTHIHSWFPIVERCDLLRVMHTTGHPNNSPDTDAGVRLTLWAILAYVSASRHDSSSQLDPSPTQIQGCIHLRVITDCDIYDLSYIQALLILGLLYIERGELSRVWILVAHATRMLTMLHASARTQRYRHTFQACVMLDNLISALLDRTPCLSLHEQTEHGPIGENGLEEWDLWTTSPRMRPKSPLRALSTFNMIHQLMLHLTRVLYSPLGEDSMKDILGELHRWRESHPYNKKDHPSNPPLLTLNLSWTFSIASSILKCVPVNSHLASLGIDTARSTLEMLDHYIQTTKTSSSSPLLSVFALQAQRCLKVSTVGAHCKEKDALDSRLETYLKSNGEGVSLGSTAVSTYTVQCDTYTPNFCNNNERQGSNLPAISAQQESLDLPSTALVSDVASGQPASQEKTPDLDMLFEEMVAAIPTTRHEPIFAHNLGFCAGDLDTDFVSLLQGPEE